MALVALSISSQQTSIQCIYNVSSLISTVSVPGVSVIELAKIMRPILDFKTVLVLTIPGLMGNEGVSTRRATSRFDLINSIRNTIRYIKVYTKEAGVNLSSSKIRKFAPKRRVIIAERINPTIIICPENELFTNIHTTIKMKNSAMKFLIFIYSIYYYIYLDIYTL